MEKQKELISLAEFYAQVRECIMSAQRGQTYKNEMLHATLVQLFESLTEEQKASLSPHYLMQFSAACRIVGGDTTSERYQEKYADYCKNNKANNTEQF